MTTIAFRDGTLAGDSRVSAGDMVITDKATKVHRLRDGRLLGWSGSVEDAHRLRQSLSKKTPRPANLNVTALLVHTDGSIHLFEGNEWVKQTEPYYSLGSGSPYAMGAMDAGATATEAARIGSKRDVSSGGKIKCVKLK